MCTLFVIKDVSANEEYQEEEFCTEEEEESFDHLTNQGKLRSMQAMLVQASKDTIAIYLLRASYLSQVFILQSFTLLFIKVFL